MQKGEASISFGSDILSHEVSVGIRNFFIGDVHGCYEELRALIVKTGIRDEDHLYFVGDLINKGPQSREVVEFAKSRPNTWSVMGNHELFYVKRPVGDPGFDRAGPLFEQYKDEIDHEVPDKYKGVRDMFQDEDIRSWIFSLPTVIERERFIVVHGGIHPDSGLDTPVEVASLLRTVHGRPWYEYYEGEKLIIYGHWAADGLRIRKNTIGLDTGCCFGGHLTAFCLETGEFWQERARGIYEMPRHWED